MSSGALSFFLVMFCQVYSTPFLLILHLFLRFLLSTFSTAHKTHPHLQSEICLSRPVFFFTLTWSFSAVCFMTQFCYLLQLKVIVHPKMKIMSFKLTAAIDLHSGFFSLHTMEVSKEDILKNVGNQVAGSQGRTGHRENRENSRWPGSQFGPLPCIFFFFFIIYYYYFILLLLFLLPTECTKVIISEFAIQ